MKYNLFERKIATSWEEAEKKLLKSTDLDGERIDEDYKKAFPYDYNPEIHFIYKGELTGPYRIEKDFSLYFYNDREQVELRYRFLGEGEILEGDNIKQVPSPSPFHNWNGEEWVYDIELERKYLNGKIQITEREMEVTQAQITSRKSLGMYIASLEAKVSELLKRHSDLCYELSETYKGE
ncbi:hypothetical protein PM10SUCC1_02780 [Propionigenium maris DSM 9537]|uniref:Uncharacterized protein n=1 Tax=Propionigenium maris DSM 9537 TaxID=1123000 RepID=A0A9W6GIH4_9FUSO|nr:hypothetical protein [Propionigenium maris]GLI54763.1 hypothetical protein PM10SUCC1_02780 [Propionigenium maris DSM 9537]